MHQYIVLLSDLSYEMGLIGLAEYEERRAIAHWLSPAGKGQPDPRIAQQGDEKYQAEPEGGIATSKDTSQGGSSTSSGDEGESKDRWVEFLVLNKWMFTVGDQDNYPSVPHGHLYKKTNEWPKLNPYTGRVFLNMHAENVGLRLTKSDMQLIWNDHNFVEHCRKQVLWFGDFAPNYGFPKARFGRLRFPKWR